MKIAGATSFVNGVHIMEARIDATNILVLKMDATYALAQITPMQEGDPDGPRNIQTHGKCTAYPNNWSAKTYELLRTLFESMEEDLLPRHFNVNKEDSHGTDEERASDRGTEGPAQV